MKGNGQSKRGQRVDDQGKEGLWHVFETCLGEIDPWCNLLGLTDLACKGLADLLPALDGDLWPDDCDLAIDPFTRETGLVNDV